MMRIYQFFALVKKEVLQMLKNPKMRMTLFVAPLLQLALLGYAATMELREVNFAVLNHDGGDASRELIAAFSGSPTYVRKADFASERDMADRISAKEVKMGLIIPEDFTKKMKNGQGADVQVIIDGRNSYSAGVAMGYASDVVEKYVKRANPDYHAGVKLATRGWYNVNMNGQYFMVPALLATLSLTAFVMLVALSFAKEREAGTMDQLLLTPYSPWEILSAKGLASMFIGYIQLCFCLFFVLYAFHIPYCSSYWLLFLLFFAILTAAVGMGLFFSMFCANMQQAMIYTFLFNVPFTALSGIATPLANMPDIFQKAMLVNPMRWAVETLHMLFLEGVGFNMVYKRYLILFTIGITAYLIAGVIFMRQRRS